MFQEWEKLEEGIGTTDASFLGLCFSQKHPGISNGRWLDSQRTSSQGPCLNPGGLGEACQRLNGCNVPHRVIKAWWMVEITSGKPRGRVSQWCCSWYVPEGSIPCLCCPCPTPFGGSSWFPEFPAMWLSRRGFYDHRGATFTLYSLHLKTSTWFPGAGCSVGMWSQDALFFIERS